MVLYLIYRLMMAKNVIVDVADGRETSCSSTVHPGEGSDSPLELGRSEEHAPVLLWSKIRHQLREPFSEFCGMLFVLLIGNGVTCQVFLSKEQKGSYLSFDFGWG
jgi:hypothetical protein